MKRRSDRKREGLRPLSPKGTNKQGSASLERHGQHKQKSRGGGGPTNCEQNVNAVRLQSSKAETAPRKRFAASISQHCTAPRKKMRCRSAKPSLHRVKAINPYCTSPHKSLAAAFRRCSYYLLACGIDRTEPSPHRESNGPIGLSFAA